MNKTTIISCDENWMEQDAVIQLNKLGELPGVLKLVGLPDLHPGKTPVGVSIITKDFIYPHLVGNDIGCGMSLFFTTLERRKLKIDRLLKKAEKIKNLRDIDYSEMEYENLTSSPLGNSLGTIGGGNHFAELQEVEQIFDEDEFKNLGLEKNKIVLLVHSGSRGYGQGILDESIKVFKSQNGLAKNSQGAKDYLTKHNDAVKWGSINRDIISYRILNMFGIKTEVLKIIDSTHNSISIKEIDKQKIYIHRKGASPSDEGAILIPGSRGALTYLVKPTGDFDMSGYSLAHGAGRKWQRSMCKSKLGSKYTKESIKSTKFKGRVICNDSRLLFEEAPEAYKNIEKVIKSLEDFKLMKVIATYKPIITYK